MNHETISVLVKAFEIYGFRPQQGLLIMNLRTCDESDEYIKGKFPSPTGVTYYEYEKVENDFCFMVTCFRPQQGLLIMNTIVDGITFDSKKEFPSPTGVTYYEFERILNGNRVFKKVSVPNRGYLL